MTGGRFLKGGAAALALFFGAGQCMVVAAGAAPTATAPVSQAVEGQVRVVGGKVDLAALDARLNG